MATRKAAVYGQRAAHDYLLKATTYTHAAMSIHIRLNFVDFVFLQAV